MSKEYIEKEAAIRELCVGKVQGTNTIRLKLISIPAADVAPVVCCKDCKHYNDGWCYNPNTYDDEKTRGNTVPDWYCADGERRE